MATFFGREYFGNSLSHAYYTKNGQKSVTGKSTKTQSSGMAKKRDLNGTSISKDKGTDGKYNNTSEYNHDYYMKNKDEDKENSNGEQTGDSSKTSEDPEFDLDAAALDVIRGKYGNGAERRAALGDDYDMVQKRVNEMYKEGKFGSGSSSGSSSADSSGSGGGERGETSSSGSSRSTAWYKQYENKISDTKEKNRQKEEQKKAEEEAQRIAREEAAAKEAKKKK